jgi:poly(A) polymerase
MQRPPRHDDPSPASPAADLDETRAHRPPPALALDPTDDTASGRPQEIPFERLDPDALRVVARLRHMHHEAYFVGGCVRDLLLGAKPKDFDLATDAHPGEVRAIFRNCRLIGRRFRLAHVYFRGGKVIEVATFRKNPIDVAEDVPESGDLLITRDNVFGTAEEDAVRRDFTVNGLFYDVGRGEVLDYVGGRADLEARRIATIGDPEIRMREDPVRALRAVRFAARLGFTIAPDTFEAMRRHAGELARCAPARVLEEIFKILRCGGSGRAFELLRACGALPVVLPSLGAALDAWDEPRRRSFFAHLAALDRLVRSGEDVSEAVLLGALLMHLAPPRPPPGAAAGAGTPPRVRPEEGARAEAEALLAALVQTARLPRKIAERARLALHAQRLFREPPRRRRRGAGQQYLADGLQLLRITVEATGADREVLERWTAHQAAQPPPAPGDAAEGSRGEAVPARRAGGAEEAAGAGAGAPARGAAGAPGAAGPDGQAGGRRRRRRRGGRRRRRRGADAGAGGPPPAP